jgi:DNA-binding GntR family transcriptional regulator
MPAVKEPLTPTTSPAALRIVYKNGGRPADRAYAWIRDRIFAGRFAPGAHLKEEELAARIGVSRSPVRDALRRLSGEGMVAMERDRGTYVNEFTREEIDEIFQLRAALEAYGAALAAQRMTPAVADRLDALAAKMEALERKKGADVFSRFSLLNNEFHRTILATAGSRRLESLLEPLLSIPVFLLKHYNWRGVEVDIKRSNVEHRELIDALRARDTVWSRTRMQAHVISRRPRYGGSTEAAGVEPPEVLR